MNKREYTILKKDIMSKVKKHNGINCVKIWKGVTFPHFNVMSDIMYYLANNGYDTYSEVEFKAGGRADILVISPVAEATIIEVLHTETEKKFNAKLSKYPFPILRVDTHNFNLNSENIGDFIDIINDRKV